MAEELGEAILQLSTDDTELQSGLDSAKQGAQGLSESFVGAADMIAAAFAAIGVGLSLNEVLAATIEAERAEMLLANAVRATGVAAGFTAEQLKAQALALQNATGIEDEAIMDTQRTLMTFRNIHGQVFRDATQLTLDFAAATGRDASDAARTLGMALNDPVNGLSRLRQAGVAVTEELKANVDAMVAQGDLAGAQKLVLEQLTLAYGGTATAARDTLGGALDALKARFGDLFLEQKAAGDMLRQFVELVIGQLPNVAGVFNGVFTAIKHQIEGVVSNLFYLGQGLSNLIQGNLSAAMTSFGEIQNPIKLMAESVAQGTLAFEGTAAAIRDADLAAQTLAASAPVNAGIVAQSAQSMKAALQPTTEEYQKMMAAEQRRMKSVEDDVKKFNDIAKKQQEEGKKRNEDRVKNFDSTLSTISTLSSNSNKELAAIGKAAAITMAIRDTYVAANKALASAPPPFNYALAAAVVAAGIANVNQIRAMEQGGAPRRGETVLVGEAGPELFTAPRSGYIVPNHELGGMGGMTVNNNIMVEGIDFSDPASAGKILTGIAEAAKQGTSEAQRASNSMSELASVYSRRAS